MFVRWSVRGSVSAMFLIMAASIAASQITITQADVESLAGKFQHSYASLNASGFDLSLSGPNRTWDLSAYSFDTRSDLRLTHLVFPPAGAPDVGNPAFAQANYAIKSETPESVSWQYAKVSPAGVEVLGNIDTATIALAPGVKILGPFPDGYGTIWSSSSAASSPLIPTGFSASLNASGSIDSWGTMILPSGGGATVSRSVLRLKLVQTTTIKLGSFTIAEFSSVSYQWLTSPSDGLFYVASASTDSVGGLRTLSFYTPFNVEPVSVVAQGRSVVETPSLLPNYPNPFNPSTTIPFALPRNSHVSLTVLNSLGQTVARLLDRTLETGTYTVTFDASQMPSGLYVCQMKIDGAIQSIKMMVVK